MTLVINEYHLLDGLNSALIVCAADRNITFKEDPSRVEERQKLFEVPYLKATVSYFGMADIPTQGGPRPLVIWLPRFIERNANIQTLEAFALKLQYALNQIVDRVKLKEHNSGMHVAGFSPEGYPDFFFVTNIGKLERYVYKDCHDQYDVGSHFLGRDAQKFGWDGKNPTTVQNGLQIYRNGDFKIHVAAWVHVSEALERLFTIEEQFASKRRTSPNFRRPVEVADYVDYVRARLAILGAVFDELARFPYVGRRFDVLGLYKRSPGDPVEKIGTIAN